MNGLSQYLPSQFDICKENRNYKNYNLGISGTIRDSQRPSMSVLLSPLSTEVIIF